MSEPYVREYDERCEYIADTIDQHQVFSLPSVGYGDKSDVSVSVWEIDAEFTENCYMGKSVPKVVSGRVRQVSNYFGRTGGNFKIALSSGSVTLPEEQTTGNRHIFRIDKDNLTASIDNVSGTLTGTVTFPYWIWFYFDGNGYYTNHDTRIYSMKLYGADGQLLYNYIPVRTGNSGNFYDTVNKQMLWSSDN